MGLKKRELKFRNKNREKKDLAKDKKATRIVAAQRRADERLERERARQEKEQQKQISRQEKEARKAQQMLEREQGLTHMVDINASTVDENESRNMSNTLDNIANNTTLFQDLIKFKCLTIKIGVYPLALFLPQEVRIQCMLSTHLHLTQV